MADKKQEKVKASTQEHLDIEDVVEDLVILKNGWVAMVMSTTAVNFDILSEAEQDATIYAYGALLNSLTFPVQVLIRSKKADITSYYQHLVEAENSQPNPDLKAQIRNYREFVQSTVQQKTILDKRFYLVIHFTPLELGIKSFKKADTANKKSKAQLVVDAKNSLSPKRDHLVKQTSRLGLFTRQLSTQELIELFYDVYNPAPTGTQRVILNAASYTTPLVEPDLETPTPEPAAAEKAPAGVENEGASVQSMPLEAQPVGPVTSAGANVSPISPMPAGETVLGANPSAPEQPVIMPKAGTVPGAASQQTAQPQQTQENLPGSQQEALSSLQEAIKRASAMAEVGTQTGAGNKGDQGNLGYGGNAG